MSKVSWSGVGVQFDAPGGEKEEEEDGCEGECVGGAG